MPNKSLPDNKVIKEANSMLREVLSENMWNHSIRTYLLADCYGQDKLLDYEQDELYLCSIFHDIGFYQDYKIKDKAFQVSSSIALKEFLMHKHDVDKSRVNIMMEAIDFHSQISPRWDLSEIAGLLQVGAHMDVLGRKKRTICADEYQKILAEYPKNKFFQEICHCAINSISSFKDFKGIISPQSCQTSNHYFKL